MQGGKHYYFLVIHFLCDDAKLIAVVRLQQYSEAIRNVTPSNAQQKTNVKLDLKDAWRGGERIKADKHKIFKFS